MAGWNDSQSDLLPPLFSLGVTYFISYYLGTRSTFIFMIDDRGTNGHVCNTSVTHLYAQNFISHNHHNPRTPSAITGT